MKETKIEATITATVTRKPGYNIFDKLVRFEAETLARPGDKVHLECYAKTSQWHADELIKVINMSPYVRLTGVITINYFFGRVFTFDMDISKVESLPQNNC